MSNMVVNTNVLALNSHRAMKGVGNAQAKASQRLSSGLKINSAADDAAGLAISEKMRAQIRGLDMASKNAQDSISLVQTAEGGMQEIDNMLQRVRELTVQASNDTNEHNANGTGDRQKIQDEINQLVAEIDSMADRVEFNKKKLIEGSYSDPTKMLSNATRDLNKAQADLVTANAALTTANTNKGTAQADFLAIQNIQSGFNTQKATLDAALKTAIDALDAYAAPAAATGYTGDNVVKAAMETALNAAKNELVALANDPSKFTEANILNVFNKYLSGDAAGENALGNAIYTTPDITSANLTVNAGTSLNLNSSTAADFDLTLNTAGGGTTTATEAEIATIVGLVNDIADAMADINLFDSTDATKGYWGAAGTGATDLGNIGGAGVGAFTNAGNTTNPTTVASSGDLTKLMAEVSSTKFNADAAAVIAQKDVTKLNDEIVRLTKQVNAASAQINKLAGTTPGLYFQVGANANQGLQVAIGSVKSDVLGIGDGNKNATIDVLHNTGADITETLNVLDNALSYVTTERSKLGAAQNRLEFTIKSLDISSENLSASESRIRDTDMAKEMMNVTKANVLQQAAVSMLAQANQAPQSILKLLQ